MSGRPSSLKAKGGRPSGSATASSSARWRSCAGAAGSGGSCGGPGGGLYAEPAGNRNRHAGQRQSRRDLVVLLARFRHPRRSRPLRPDRAESPLRCRRLSLCRQALRFPRPGPQHRGRDPGHRAGGRGAVPGDRSRHPAIFPAPSATTTSLVRKQAGSLDFVQLPADHPVYIMYSSGTTGPPKCLVQGSAGHPGEPPEGTAASHRPEAGRHHFLSHHLRLDDVELAGQLSCRRGCHRPLRRAPFPSRPGSPLAARRRTRASPSSAPAPATLPPWKRPASAHAATSTCRNCGPSSPPAPPSPPTASATSTAEIKEDLQLASISGGTDLNGCFALGNPIGAVYPGELQCRGLGMKVEVFNCRREAGDRRGGRAGLHRALPVHAAPFLERSGRQQLPQGLLREVPGVWAHGDWCELTETGGMVIYGRSDATLNPGGVRIGTARTLPRGGNLPRDRRLRGRRPALGGG